MTQIVTEDIFNMSVVSSEKVGNREKLTGFFHYFHRVTWGACVLHLQLELDIQELSTQQW